MIKHIFCLSTLLLLILNGCVSKDPDDDLWKVTASVDYGRMPRWSPDELILFGDDRAGRSDIYIWEPGEETQLLADSLPGHNWDYHWSPEGSRVGFTSPGEPDSPTSGIWIWDFEDRSKRRILDRGKDLSWYYDGDAVAVRIDRPVSGLPGIYFVNIETGETEFIAEGYAPVCSPVSPAIAFMESEINGRLLLMDQELDPVPVSEKGVLHCAWSWDGSALFCTLNDYTSGDMRWDIFKITLSDNEWQPQELASWALFPAPDRSGSRVAFQRISSASWRGLWLSDRGRVVRIAEMGQNPEYHPFRDKIAVNEPDGGIAVLTKE